MEQLGPPAFNFCGKRFTRTDFTLRTKRGYNLECSHWEPVERATDRIPVLIYMHGNSSARVSLSLYGIGRLLRLLYFYFNSA
jgi:hypothetical protein